MKSNFAAIVSVLLVLALGALGYSVLGPGKNDPGAPNAASASTATGSVPRNDSDADRARTIPTSDTRPRTDTGPLPPCCGKGVGGTCSNPAQCPRLNAPAKAATPEPGPSAS